MKIEVTKNFLMSCKKLIKNFNEEEMFKKIKKLLIFDNLITKNEIVNFTYNEEKFQGIIIRDKNLVVYFSMKLDQKGKAKGRNTYISQGFWPAFKTSIFNKSKMHITINPYDLEYNVPSAESIFFSLRCFETLDIFSIGNKFNNIKPFFSIEEYLKEKRILSNKNSRNNPSYIRLQENIIELYLKLDGANAAGSFIDFLIIKKFNVMKIKIAFLDDNYENNIIAKEISSRLDANSKIIIVNKNLTNTYKKIDYEIERDQIEFTKNIFKKYDNNCFDVNKCFACSYNISENLISSHIHRVADIKSDFNDKKITYAKAIELIVSGDNGFFLCPNHDKEFEKGILFFDLNKKTFKYNENKLFMSKHENIINTINSYRFDKFINENFIYNVEKHLKRVKIIESKSSNNYY